MGDVVMEGGDLLVPRIKCASSPYFTLLFMTLYDIHDEDF